MPPLSNLIPGLLNALPSRLRLQPSVMLDKNTDTTSPRKHPDTPESDINKPRVDPDRQLILPCQTHSDEETRRARHQDRGQFLARQERWEDLHNEIAHADASRAATPSGVTVATLLAAGARSDVVLAAEDALNDAATPGLAGIEALEQVLAEHPGLYGIALVTALAHIDIGWAWRGTGWRCEVSPRHKQLFQAHFARAEAILDAHCSLELNAPSLAGARCALLAAQARPQDRVADDYEDLIDLDPHNPHPMRAMGNHLLPRWFGSYQTLELEARRTAARSAETWGAGAYTWVYLDALAVDPMAAHNLDVDFFVEGMRDILARQPNQHTVNRMAAFAAITMSPDRAATDLTPQATAARAALATCLDWIIAEHLHEVHPLIWAAAAAGPDIRANPPPRNALVHLGQTLARATIARHFADDLDQGTTISISKHGLRRYPAL
jgi:hypothetical protein